MSDEEMLSPGEAVRAYRQGLVDRSPAIDVEHLVRQRDWSARTFGPGSRGGGVTDHIIKELRDEVREGTPYEDASEWIDVIILAFDGALRSGLTPEEIIGRIKAKQTRNEARTWPDWRTAEPGKAIEHDRSAEHTEYCLLLPDSEYDPKCPTCSRLQDMMKPVARRYEGYTGNVSAPDGVDRG